MAETDPSKLRFCSVCESQGLDAADDGFFYCLRCGSQAEDIIDTGVADEDFVDKGLSQGSALYLASHKRHQPMVKPEPVDYDFMGPTEPADFGSRPLKGVVIREEDYYRTIRMRYVMGVQLMVQFQCEALVQKFNVNPLVCGIAGSVWLRFVASTRVFDDGWADQAMLNSESQGEKKCKVGKAYEGEPRNIYKERMVIIWCKSLKKTIPLSCSLAISYLACHIAREPVLTTDILRWTIEGKLPYFSAFTEIEKSIKEIEKSNGQRSVVCPLSASYMFRPSQAVPLQKLESMAASIAQSLGLNLPPVNFYGIASRYLKQLSLPVGKIIPYACRIYEWSMPPDLWLSANELRLPTRVCVMSILIVAIRILYNINGFGKWEMTISAPVGSSMDDQVENSDPTCESVHKFDSDGAELLRDLEKRYDEINNRYEYSKDLPTYLQYCKDVVFAGLEPLYEDHALIEQLWNFYQRNREDSETSGQLETGLTHKRPRETNKLFNTPVKESKKLEEEQTTSSPSTDSRFTSQDARSQWGPNLNEDPQSSQANNTSASTNQCDIEIRHMKIDMEEHRFCYIPPRVNVKRHDYLHYARKRDDGSLTYVAHADYYILLRACAKVAQVDVRVMHVGVLSLEKRLGWIEKKIDHCLQEECSNHSGKSCTNLPDESVSLSNLNL